MLNNNINEVYLSNTVNNILKKAIEDKSFTFPLLYNGDSWEVGKAIEALEYLFEKAYKANEDEETRTRLSQMGTIYLNPIIVELRDYKERLDKYNKTMNFYKVSNDQFERHYYGNWYTEFKGEENGN